MNCSCDYDYPEFWTREDRRAAKPYRCEECAGVIQKGESYEYVFGKWEGCPGFFRTCSRCADLRQWMTNNLPCFCWAHSNLHEDIRLAADDAAYRAGDEIKGFRFALGRRVVGIRRHNAQALAA